MKSPASPATAAPWTPFLPQHPPCHGRARSGRRGGRRRLGMHHTRDRGPRPGIRRRAWTAGLVALRREVRARHERLDDARRVPRPAAVRVQRLDDAPALEAGRGVERLEAFLGKRGKFRERRLHLARGTRCGVDAPGAHLGRAVPGDVEVGGALVVAGVSVQARRAGRVERDVGFARSVVHRARRGEVARLDQRAVVRVFGDVG